MKRKIIITVLCCVFALSVISLLWNFIRFDITVQTDGNGRVFCEKQSVRLFESTVLWIEPNKDAVTYELGSLIIDGEDVTGEVIRNKYKISWVFGDKAVYASFKQGNEPVASASRPVFV